MIKSMSSSLLFIIIGALVAAIVTIYSAYQQEKDKLLAERKADSLQLKNQQQADTILERTNELSTANSKLSSKSDNILDSTSKVARIQAELIEEQKKSSSLQSDLKNQQIELNNYITGGNSIPILKGRFYRVGERMAAENKRITPAPEPGKYVIGYTLRVYGKYALSAIRLNYFQEPMIASKMFIDGNSTSLEIPSLAINSNPRVLEIDYTSTKHIVPPYVVVVSWNQHRYKYTISLGTGRPTDGPVYPQEVKILHETYEFDGKTFEDPEEMAKAIQTSMTLIK